MFKKFLLLIWIILIAANLNLLAKNKQKTRARDLGIQVGILPTGEHNSITDVVGVTVGHKTLIKGDSIRTGVTVILPHQGNLYQEKVPAAIFLGNAYGKLAGYPQVEELGNIETPIALTNTLNIPIAVQSLVKYTIRQRGNENVMSVNAVAGETNDGWLNDIRGMHVKEQDVFDAIKNAKKYPIGEGCVGAGTGTTCFGFKGGIGTSSRILPKKLGGYTVGVLVQTNYGGVLTVNGAPVGRELGKFALKKFTTGLQSKGSCMIVVATDAPLSSRNLKRLAKRGVLGLGKTGSPMHNGSGDFVISFSTAYKIPNNAKQLNPAVSLLSNNKMSPLFMAVVEATEEAVYNAMLSAETIQGFKGHKLEAISHKKLIKVLKKYNLLNLQKELPSIKIEFLKNRKK